MEPKGSVLIPLTVAAARGTKIWTKIREYGWKPLFSQYVY